MLRGSMVFDEVIIPLHEIRLQDGDLVFIGQITGPVPQVRATTFNLHDPQGRLVVQRMRLATRMEFGPIRPDVRVIVELAVHMQGGLTKELPTQSGTMPW